MTEFKFVFILMKIEKNQQFPSVYIFIWTKKYHRTFYFAQEALNALTIQGRSKHYRSLLRNFFLQIKNCKRDYYIDMLLQFSLRIYQLLLD